MIEGVPDTGERGAIRMRRSGFSAVEVGVAMLIAAVVGVPMLSLLFQGRDTEQRSRFELLAVLAARDDMYQSRLLVACGAAPASVAKTPQPLDGNPCQGLQPIFRGTLPDVRYYEIQKRVVASVTMKGPVNGASPRIHLAEAEARWNEVNGVARDGRKASVVLPFGVLVPP